jgi:hypothetical protein
VRFLRSGVFHLQKHTVASTDRLDSLLRLFKALAAEDRDLRYPDPKRRVHGSLLLTHLDLFSSGTRAIANP